MTLQDLAFGLSDRGVLLCVAAEVHITVLSVLSASAPTSTGVCNQLRRLSFYNNSNANEIPVSVCATGRGQSQDFVVAWGPAKGDRGGGSHIDMFATQELSRGPVHCVQLHGTFAESVDVGSENGSWQIAARAENGGLYLITEKNCMLSVFANKNSHTVICTFILAVRKCCVFEHTCAVAISSTITSFISTPLWHALVGFATITVCNSVNIAFV